MLYAKSDCIDRSTKHVCSWERASFDDITSYKANIYIYIRAHNTDLVLPILMTKYY